MHPTVYKSVDAAVKDLIGELPLIRLMKSKMEASGESKTNQESYKRICAVVEMPSDEKAFRGRLEVLKNPDGSVQFSMTPEAFKLFRSKFPSA